MTRGVKIKAVLSQKDARQHERLSSWWPGGENMLCYVLNIHVNQMFRCCFTKDLSDF